MKSGHLRPLLHQNGNTKELLINHLNKRFSVGTRNSNVVDVHVPSHVRRNDRYTHGNILESVPNIKTVDGLRGIIVDS
jgi:hypothetical protein